MTTRERKLLRKQINLKLKCLANKESKENDFSNSSQMITLRQQRYMTISRYFRAQDNCGQSKKLPFDVEKTSLPHVNLSLLNRLYESTNNVMKSENFDKILSVHSFRTKTPFYTNPELTLDRGKVMNYSAHIGAVLHTPRYIEFIKSTPEYISTQKSQQPPGAGKPNRFPVSDSFSFSTTPVASDSRTESNCSESQMSSLGSEKKKNKKQKYIDKSKTSSIRRTKEEDDNNKEIKSNTVSVHQDSVFSLDLENEENLEPEDVIKSSRVSSLTSSKRMEEKIDEKEARKSKLITVERNVETSPDTPRKNSSDMKGSILSNDDWNDMGNIWSGTDGENCEKNKEEKRENRDLEIELKFMTQESFDENEEINKNLESQEKSSTRSSLKLLTESDVHKKEKLEINSFKKLKEKKVTDEYKNNSIGHSLPEESSQADSLTTLKEKQKNESEFPESLISKVVLDRQIAIDENEMADSSADSLDAVSETGSKYGLIVPKVEDFFKCRQINKKDFDLINRFFDMVDKYRFSRPKYVKEFGVHLLKNNSAHFLDFHNILLSHKIKNITADESEYIKNIIKKIGLENTNILTLQPYTSSRMEQITQHNPKTNNPMNMDEPHDEETKEIDIISEKEVKETSVNSNIINTIKRIFPVEDIDKYDIKIETEGLEKGESIENEDDIEAEDFAESFRNLFRNSITVMNSNELGDLKRLVAEYRYEDKNERTTKEDEKENNFLEEFKELFEEEKEEMSEEDFNKLQNLLENDFNDSESAIVKKFDLLLKRYNQRISDEALTKISGLIRTEKENLRRLSLSLSNDKEDLMEEKEETEVMLAFRNLFKSSIGEINKNDLEKIQRIIDEHEMEESQ